VTLGLLFTIPLPDDPAKHKAALRVRDALVEVREQPLLRMLLLAILVYSVVVTPIQELAPAIAKQDGDGAHLLGFLLAALAAGGIVGNVARTQLEKRGVGTRALVAVSMIWSGASLALLAATSTFALDLLAMALCGVAWEVIFVVCLTGVQFADPRASGLLTGLFFAVTLGGMTVGALIIGGFFDWIGVDLALVLCAVSVAAGGAWLIRPGRAESLLPQPVSGS
jgi:DHA1 family L-arabinose/isopropyl-beta-D-thiogalactopyranoside export protein-like MFS transporter